MKKLRLKSGLTIALLSIMAVSFSFIIMTTEKVGVLVLAHGGKHKSWDKTVYDATEPLKKQYPVEVAFGMANPMTIQQGIDKLESQSVTKIVAVPLFISSYSPIIRQNEYLLGMRKELADEPMIMDHSSGGHNEHHGHYSPNSMNDTEKTVELKPLNFKSKIILTKPLNNHPLVVEILWEHIYELSQQPKNETVIIVAHGPNDEEDNKNWIKTMDNIADQIRTKQLEKDKKFKQIFCVTVRDDADKAIYEQAKEHLRTLVYQSSKDGEVIVIPLLLAQGGVEERFVERLEGLKYKWSGKTLLPHPNITKFIQTSVENALK